jgi:2-(1,2-epoxy-1,2-dihydrophenyl)acetyl-CoA isomerase
MTEDASPDFLVARRDGVLWLRLNRPEHGNAIAAASVPGLTSVFQEAQADQRVRCIVIGGNGKHFCSGGDVAGFARDLERSVEARQMDFRERLGRVANLVEAVVAFDRPIIAAVHGAIAGAGLMLALCADLVIGDENSVFLFSHRRVGLSPDAGVSYFLPRIVGVKAASRLVLTAARVEAAEALALGLLGELVSGEAFEARVAKLADQMAKSPQQAVKLAKWLLYKSPAATLSEQLAAERDAIETLVATSDFEEGVRAFMGKRPAVFPSCATPD